MKETKVGQRILPPPMQVPMPISDRAEARRIVREFPSFRDFVDDALFHPAWGYYSTGRVRFGEGGHYDTFPLALSPLFGRMLAEYAFRVWRRRGRPSRFELCEIGAGNGQLCLDVIVWLDERARHEIAWKRFAAALRYRIVERSAALIARQRETLGSLSDAVVWTRADLSRRPARGTPFAACGLVFANEVLDCLAHHKIVCQPDRTPGVVFVVPCLPETRRAGGRRGGVQQVAATDRAIPRASLAQVMCDDALRRQVAFREVSVPVGLLPGLDGFLRRHYPEFFAGRTFKPYFACPAIAPVVRNAAALYESSETLWVDYGGTRDFHLRSPAHQRVFAGPPNSGATAYRDPGHDDLTFLVDFSVVAEAVHDAGLRVKFYGGQGELARRGEVVLDRSARDLIARSRALGWMLALVGVGAEREWRKGSLTWAEATGGGGRLRDDVRKAVDEFLGKRASNFRLMIVA